MVKKLETYRRALIFGTHILWVDRTGERIIFSLKDPEAFHFRFSNLQQKPEMELYLGNGSR